MTDPREADKTPAAQDTPDVDGEALKDLDASGDEGEDVRGGSCYPNSNDPGHLR